MPFVDNHELTTARIADCRELYLKHKGQHHEQIEREMRALGHTDFHRRILYRRFERGRCVSGWIERYGFDSLVKERLRQRGNALAGNAGALACKAGSSGLTYAAGYQPEHEMIHQLGRARSSAAPQPVGTGLAGEGACSPGVVAPDAPPLDDFPEFLKWLKLVSPNMEWEWKHQVYIYKRLRRVSEGLCDRLMIFLPPRHGKSELVTVRYAAWCLKQDPAMNVIIGSYNQRLANRFSRKIKRVLADDHALSDAETSGRGDAVKEAISTDEKDVDRVRLQSPRLAVSASQCLSGESPFPFVRQRSANTEAEWETKAGGGLRSVGVGSGVTGFGANLIIIDDPVKSRAEAESRTIRDNIWDWFNDDLYTRLEPDGKIILIQTRWHEDDLAGRLLREAKEEGGEQWEVINLPALAEGSSNKAEPPALAGGTASRANNPTALKTNPTLSPLDLPVESMPPAYAGGSALKTGDPLGRAVGEALCPERFDEKKLARLKSRLGSYSFAALYQQRPVPADGGLFKREWFAKNIIAAAPAGLRWKRGYDPGVSNRAAADYTASFRIAYDRDGNMYIDGGFRKQIEYPELRRYILGRILAERDTDHGVELSANGHAVIQDLRHERRIQGRTLRGVRVTDTKIARALPWIALAEAGKVFLVRGNWNTDFIDEAAAFPSGTHDDQIDAVSIAVRMARNQNRRLHLFL